MTTIKDITVAELAALIEHEISHAVYNPEGVVKRVMLKYMQTHVAAYHDDPEVPEEITVDDLAAQYGRERIKQSTDELDTASQVTRRPLDKLDKELEQAEYDSMHYTADTYLRDQYSQQVSQAHEEFVQMVTDELNIADLVTDANIIAVQNVMRDCLDPDDAERAVELPDWIGECLSRRHEATIAIDKVYKQADYIDLLKRKVAEVEKARDTAEDDRDEANAYIDKLRSRGQWSDKLVDTYIKERDKARAQVTEVLASHDHVVAERDAALAQVKSMEKMLKFADARINKLNKQLKPAVKGV